MGGLIFVSPSLFKADFSTDEVIPAFCTPSPADACGSALSLLPVAMLMLLPFAGTSASETITFTLPENMVLGTERAHISFLGEIQRGLRK